MFLLHSIRNKKLISNKNLKDYIKNLNNQILLLKKIRQKQQQKNLQAVVLKDQKQLKKRFYKNIKYTIIISVLKSNIFIHLTDIKGNLKLLVSAGTANLIGKRQKSKQQLALTRALTVLITKTQYLVNQPVLVYIKGAKLAKSNFSSRYVIGTILEKRFNIIYYINGTLLSHNGCRPKKIRRGKKKAKKLKFIH